MMFSLSDFIETLVVCAVAGGARYFSSQETVIDGIQVSGPVVAIVTYILVILLGSISVASISSIYDSETDQFYVVNLIVQVPLLYAAGLVSITSVRKVARRIELSVTSRSFGLLAFFLAVLAPLPWLIAVLDHPSLLDAGIGEAIASAPNVVGSLIFVSVPISIGILISFRLLESFRFSMGFASVVAVNAPVLTLIQMILDENDQFVTALSYMSLLNCIIATMTPKSPLQAGVLVSGAMAAVGFFVVPLFEVSIPLTSGDAHRIFVLTSTVALAVYKRNQTTDPTVVGLATLLAVSLTLRLSSLALDGVSEISAVLFSTVIGVVAVSAAYAVVVLVRPDQETSTEERVDQMALDSA
jgi:hypothetical protein